jgi:hypothetical protein
MLMDWEGRLPRESAQDYHQRDTAISSSNIKHMDKSPWHYKRFVIDGVSMDKASLSFGSLAHEIVFEGKIKDIVCLPDFEPIVREVPGKRPGTTKKETLTIKSQVEAFKELNKERRIVTRSEFDKLVGMDFSLSCNALAQKYLSDDDMIEESFLYHDEKHDLKCRFRPDRLNLERGICVDYKTAASAQEHAFKWAVIRYGYHISAAHYLAGLERLYPGKIKEFIFIVQETSEPYACGVYKLSETDIQMGRDIRDHLIRKIQKHTEADFWPQYNAELKELLLPDVMNEGAYEA